MRSRNSAAGGERRMTWQWLSCQLWAGNEGCGPGIVRGQGLGGREEAQSEGREVSRQSATTPFTTLAGIT